MAKLYSLAIHLLIFWFYEGKQNNIILILVQTAGDFKTAANQTDRSLQSTL